MRSFFSRRRSRPGSAAAAAAPIYALFLLASSCRSLSPPPSAPARPVSDDLGLSSLVESPSIRVGVTSDAKRASFSADSGVTVWLVLPGAREKVKRDLARATFTPQGGVVGAGSYHVQVASFADEAEARRTASRAAKLGSARVEKDTVTGAHRVWVGQFAKREAAVAAAADWGGAFPGAFVGADPQATGSALRLLETGDVVARAGVVPQRGDEPLSLDGVEYRGVFEARVNEGAVTAINVLGLEDYVRGVVPNELSPKGFPEIEALKAQAVAARTYATRNRGQFAEKGYDICATPSCQVYRGRSSEDPLSDQAVAQTHGVVATFAGEPINAVYTSTCGGHTEDGDNVFEGRPTPYLKGVACQAERTARGEIHGRVAAGGGDGRSNRAWALLTALGVLSEQGYVDRARSQAPTPSEIEEWTARTLAASARAGCESGIPAAARRGGLFRYLVDRFCWVERRRLANPADEDYLLRVEDVDELGSPEEREAAALLVQDGVLRPSATNRLQPEAPASRDDLVSLLAEILGRLGAPSFVNAEFRFASGDRLGVRSEGGDHSYALQPRVALFRRLGGDPIAASRVTLVPGDSVAAVVERDRVVFLEVGQDLRGTAADRSSKYFRWEVRLTPEEVATSIARYGNVGRVLDIEPRRLGVSGRVVSLAIKGDRGDLLLNGLKIRFALGLKENLFVLDREQGPSGVGRFVFTGKGWGHGVGLCQVGAFGLARAGADFETILKHYYTGIALGKAH